MHGIYIAIGIRAHRLKLSLKCTTLLHSHTRSYTTVQNSKKIIDTNDGMRTTSHTQIIVLAMSSSPLCPELAVVLLKGLLTQDRINLRWIK